MKEMSDTRLICFEGMPGSGKSTTSQRLWLHLLRNGRDARGSTSTTAHIRSGTSMNNARSSSRAHSTRSFLADVLIDRWRNLADRLAGPAPTTVLDGSLFQTPIGFLLALDLAKPAILAHLLEVEKTIARVHPALVYIRNADVASALRATCDDRRSDQFETALIERIARTPYGMCPPRERFRRADRLLQARREIADELFDRFEIPKLAVDPVRRMAGARARDHGIPPFAQDAGPTQ